MRTTLTKTDTNKGVHLPREVVEQAHLGDEIDLMVVNDAVIIRTAQTARAGWEQAAAECHGTGDDYLEEWDAVTTDNWNEKQ